MKKSIECLYCGNEKNFEEMSLEHAIPQFLGGAYAPEKFKLSNVCIKCNNILGLYVDAGYAKSWMVSMGLAESARKYMTSYESNGLPLRCLGRVEIDGVIKPDDYIIEYWIGPSGESIFWVRFDDLRMDTFMGGNPTDKRNKKSVAYYFPVNTTSENQFFGMRSFHQSMGKKNKVKKVLCAEVADENGVILDPNFFGFTIPEESDTFNERLLFNAINSGDFLRLKFKLHAGFDKRFICKLGLGVGYSIFKEQINDRLNLFQRGIWPKQDDSEAGIRGSSTLNMLKGDEAANLPGYPGAISICIINDSKVWMMCVTIDEKLPFVIELCNGAAIAEGINQEEGYQILLFPYLQKCIETTLPEVIAHRHGYVPNPLLTEIDAMRDAATKFGFKLKMKIDQKAFHN